MPNAGKTISAEPTPIAPPPTARTQTQAVQAELPPDSGSGLRQGTSRSGLKQLLDKSCP